LQAHRTKVKESDEKYLACLRLYPLPLGERNEVRGAFNGHIPLIPAFSPKGRRRKNLYPKKGRAQRRRLSATGLNQILFRMTAAFHPPLNPLPSREGRFFRNSLQAGSILQIEPGDS